MSNLRQFGEALELEGDFVLREIIPFYGSFTTSVTEKSLQKLIEYYQEQFSQLTNSIANDQENIFSEVKNVLKEKNNKIAEMERGYDKLKEQADAEREERKRERKADDEKLAIVEREKEEIQNALLSTEKSEIEQLKAERNQLRTNTEEQEKFLTRLFKEYENLELRRKLTVKELELMFLEFKKRGTEAEQLRSDKIALSTDNTILNERVKNLTKDIKEAKDKITELTSEKVNLEAQVTNLEIEKKD
jgi:chromosome segregation ATPase